MPPPNLRVDDPAIQAAIDELRANPRDILPKPEAVTLGLLRWLLGFVEGPCPIAADEPDRNAVYIRVWFLVDAVPGIKELTTWLNSEMGVYLTAPATIAVRGQLAKRLGRSFDEVDRLLIADAVKTLREPPQRVQSADAAAPASRSVTPEAPAELPGSSLTAGGKAIAAAYELHSEGKAVTIAAAAKRARVNRSHVYTYPEAIRLIKVLATATRRPPRGRKDPETRNIEAWHDE